MLTTLIIDLLCLPFICSYHHILLDICLGESKTLVLHSQKRLLSLIYPVIDVPNK